MSDRRGADLALLLLGGFEAMVDEVVAELARRDHPGVRAGHEFALRAIDDGAGTAAELGRKMDVSKQAAAKTIAAPEQMGYVTREDDHGDARRKRLRVIDRGREMTVIGQALFDEVRERWAQQIGRAELDELQEQLARLLAMPSSRRRP